MAVELTFNNLRILFGYYNGKIRYDIRLYNTKTREYKKLKESFYIYNLEHFCL